MPETDKYNTLGIPKNIEETNSLVKAWLNLCEEQPRKKYVFNIDIEEKKFIGLIGINIGKPGYSSAEIWFKIHSEYWNKGYATESLKTVLKYCFDELKLHRVSAGCAVENTASKKVLEKAGMIKEGQCRKILPIRGKWHDNFEFAILEADFDSK